MAVQIYKSIEAVSRFVLRGDLVFTHNKLKRRQQCFRMFKESRELGDRSP